jgi:hypothetical protein
MDDDNTGCPAWEPAMTTKMTAMRKTKAEVSPLLTHHDDPPLSP